jgi:3-dehydroquinate synthase
MQVHISLKKVVDDSYDIFIDTLPKLHFDTKVAVVTIQTVSKLHLDYLLG